MASISSPTLAGAAFCLALVAAPVRAQEAAVPLVLTPELAREILLMRNPEILRERENVAIARAGVVGARVRPNPDLDVISEGYPLFEPNRGPFLQNSELFVRLGQPIETAGKRGKRVRAAEQDVSVVTSLLEDTIRRLDLELKTRYFRVVHAKADHEVTHQALAQFDEIARLTELRHQQGEASRLDLVRVETARSHFHDDLIQADVALQNARIALLELLGSTDLRAEFDVTETLDFFETPAGGLDLEALVGEALEARTDLLARREHLVGERHRLAFERALRVPDVTPFFGYHRHRDDNAVTFGIRTELPLFNRNQGGVARAAARVSQAEVDQHRAELLVRREVHEAYQVLRGHERRVQAFATTSVPSAQRARELTHPAYRLGALELLVLLDAEDAYRHTLRTYNQALLDHHLARFRLEAAIGRDLP